VKRRSLKFSLDSPPEIAHAVLEGAERRFA
jgi:hypothetical protein